MRKHQLWRGLAFSIALIFLFPLYALADGFDRQTPQEIEAARLRVEHDFADAVTLLSLNQAQKNSILAQYAHLDPTGIVPSDLLRDAVVYFDANKSRFRNQAYITVVDFKPRSDSYRFFLVNMETGSVERYHTTHGLGSDKNEDGWAEIFGNVINSGKTSLGFARTAEVYVGKFRRSLRLDGLSSTNSNIRERAIVFHGWDNANKPM